MAERDEHGYGVASVVFMFLAIVLAFTALFVAGVAFARSNDANDAARQAAGTRVVLSEFAIEPSQLEVPEGAVLTVTNEGGAIHDLVVVGTEARTPELEPGDTATLDLTGLEPATYEIRCDVSGHAEAGMTGTLAIGGAHDDHDMHPDPAANDATDDRMLARTAAFPAETEGLGAQLLEPTILPDGTKEYVLVAEEIDWEVEPGKVVRAMAYNGQVPGPMLVLDDGDAMRVVLRNEMTESTSIHWHGLLTPNSMDGVPGITQPVVKPGEEFVYQFVARGPAVGTYHSHHHAERQVPNGLFGPIIVGDPPVPEGVTVSQEIPMVLNDAGVIGLSLNGKSFPATAPIVASLGEYVLIHYMNEGLQVHPMHLHGLPQLVIARDGFPVPEPYLVDNLLVSPGERYTVLVHANEPGVWAFHCHIVNHAEGPEGMFGMVTAFVVE